MANCVRFVYFSPPVSLLVLLFTLVHRLLRRFRVFLIGHIGHGQRGTLSHDILTVCMLGDSVGGSYEWEQDVDITGGSRRFYSRYCIAQLCREGTLLHTAR